MMFLFRRRPKPRRRLSLAGWFVIGIVGLPGVSASATASPYGDALSALNRKQYEEAARFFSAAIASNLEAEASLWYRSEIRALQRRPVDAFADCDRLRQVMPKSPASLLARARVCEILGDDAGVERNLRAVISTFPKYPGAYDLLAWRLATNPSSRVRNGREAVRLAQRGCELTRFEKWTYLETLAAACAEAGNWPEAIRMQRDAIGRLQRRLSQGPASETLAEMNHRLRDFQSSKPYRKAPDREVSFSGF